MKFLALEKIPDVDGGKQRYDMFVKAYTNHVSDSRLKVNTATTLPLLLEDIQAAEPEDRTEGDSATANEPGSEE